MNVLENRAFVCMIYINDESVLELSQILWRYLSPPLRMSDNTQVMQITAADKIYGICRQHFLRFGRLELTVVERVVTLLLISIALSVNISIFISCPFWHNLDAYNGPIIGFVWSITPLQLIDQVKAGVFFITCVCPVHQPLLFYKVALVPLLPNLIGGILKGHTRECAHLSLTKYLTRHNILDTNLPVSHHTDLKEER